MTKTSVVKVSKGFYPVVWFPHFLWGGEWKILWSPEEGIFYTMSTMKDEYLLSSDKEASELLEKYEKYIQDRKKVFGK